MKKVNGSPLRIKREQLRRDTRAYYEGGYILAFLRLKQATAINRIFLGNPVAQADGYGSRKIFHYDGKALYLSIIKMGSRTEAGPVLDPKLLELIQNDPCVSTQLTTRLGANGIYFFSNCPSSKYLRLVSVFNKRDSGSSLVSI